MKQNAMNHNSYKSNASGEKNENTPTAADRKWSLAISGHSNNPNGKNRNGMCVESFGFI